MRLLPALAALLFGLPIIYVFAGEAGEIPLSEEISEEIFEATMAHIEPESGPADLAQEAFSVARRLPVRWSMSSPFRPKATACLPVLPAMMQWTFRNF
jgi:hypothetical protein